MCSDEVMKILVMTNYNPKVLKAEPLYISHHIPVILHRDYRKQVEIITP